MNYALFCKAMDLVHRRAISFFEVVVVKPRFVILSAASLLAVTLAGCGDFKSVFTYNKTTGELIEPAQTVVKTELQENFGTPEALVAWLKFQFDFGEEESVTVKVNSFDTAAKGVVVVDNTDDLGVDLEGATLKLSTDAVHDIVSYDSESGQLHVTPPIATELTDEDSVTIVTKPQGWKLVRGRNLYMIHCVHCHGVSGDGAGPTAKYLNPLPRDYRKGIFKFTSTISTEKAAHRDFRQTLYEGIQGTSMPSFKLKLIGDDMDAVIAYVLFLSSRGEYEINLGNELKVLGGGKQEVNDRLREEQGLTEQQVFKEFKEQEELSTGLTELSDGVAMILSEDWERANSPEVEVFPKKPRPEPTAESIARGRALFISKDAKCSDCHGMQGNGNGPQTEAYQQLPGSSLTYDKPGLYDDWGHPIKPRNLHTGIYRGGRRPLDIYRRISAGIKGALMPGFGTSLSDDQIWDLVNYVMSIPYENNLSPESVPAEKTVAEHITK